MLAHAFEPGGLSLNFSFTFQNIPRAQSTAEYGKCSHESFFQNAHCAQYSCSFDGISYSVFGIRERNLPQTHSFGIDFTENNYAEYAFFWENGVWAWFVGMRNAR